MTTTADTASEILEENANTYREKNQDYGESWKLIGYVLTELAHDKPIVIDSAEKAIAFGLFTRRLDKFAREFHGTFFADDLNFEGVFDSAIDESTYAAMSAENHRDMERQATVEERMAEGYREASAETEDDNSGHVTDTEWLGRLSRKGRSHKR